MDILGGITAATEGLKLVNELRKVDRELDKAELKLRLVDVADKLLDSKQALQDAHEREVELRREVARLEEAISRKAKLLDKKGLLHEVNDSGETVGEPYCNLCFVREDKLYRMRHVAPTSSSFEHYTCDNCKTNIRTGPALPRQKLPPRRGAWTV